MTMGTVPILDFRGLPQSRAWGHGELGPPQACRMEAGAGSDHDGTRNMSRVPGRQFAIFIQVSNRGRFCQYISLPMKYTVSGSTLQYKVGLTLSFLSLISRGVGGIQNCNTSMTRTKNSGVEAGTLSFYMFSLAIIWGSSPQLQTK